jgi:hypothetical protein
VKILKEELLQFFNELLDRWEDAEYAWINEHGISSDYDNIEKEKQDFIERLNKILK